MNLSKMWILRICFLVVFLDYLKGDDVTSRFLIDYVDDKSYMVTAHFCWTHSEINTLLKMNLNANNSKEMVIFNNNTNHYKYLKHLSNNNLFVISLNLCESSWKLLDTINITLEFRWPLKFLLLIDEAIFESDLVPKLANYTIFPTTDMMVAKRIGDDFELSQPYRIDSVHAIKWESCGNWTNGTLNKPIKYIPIVQRRINLEWAKMNVVLYIEFDDTWNHLEDFKIPRIDTFTKQNHLAIKAMLEMCKINYTFIQERIWGYYNETTKSWNGLVEAVRTKRAHIAGSSPYFTIERHSVVDFIKMQNPLEIRFVMKKPPLSYMYNIFTLPFQSNVWKALAGLMGLFLIALYLNINWEVRHFDKINNKTDFTTSDITLIVFEAICQQGSTTECKSPSGRVLTLFMFISFMFLYCSYSAFIVVLLQSTHTIRSYEELLDSNMGAGGMETTYMRVYLADSKKLIQQKLYNKKIGPKGFYQLEDGMAKVQAGFFAFHAEVAASYDYIVQKFTDYEICNVQIMEGYNEFRRGYTSVPKNSPYKKVFKVSLMKIEEYGIQRRNYLRYIRKPTCYSGGGTFGSVGLIDSYNALIIWAVGIAIAFAIFLMELLVFKMKRKHFEKKERLTKISEAKQPPAVKYYNWK